LLAGARSGRAASAELRGILITLAAMLLFGLMDAGSKFLSTRYPVPQILWLRYILTVPLLLIVLAPGGLARRLRSARPGLQVGRALLLVVEIGLVVWCFGQLPLADVHAVLALTALAVTALSVPLLGEQVGPRRWAAVGAGFFGVLVILRPGPAEALNIGAILVIVSCALSGATTLMVKDLLRTESSNAVVTYMVLLMTPISLAPALFVWSWPEPWTWAILIGMGLVATIGHICITHSYKLAEASAVLPYDYTRMIFAAAIGYLWFAEIPDLWTWVGAGIIAASAIYIAHREALYGQASASQSATGPAAMPPARPVPADERRD